ncbi:MAG TPA: 2'-5' RNA ligase family protein [Ramlibacter sp.]|nr:2'-5' RNA ligase family protein [Ramlibacter sp.]
MHSSLVVTATPAAPLRLFLALWPPQAVHQALLAHAGAWSWPPSARRTPAERLHVTLHFLGDVAGERLPTLRQELAVPWPGCEMELDRAQVWPGGIAVLEALTVPPPLAALHAALAGRLQALDIAVDARRLRPHVTFARKAFGAQPPARFAALRWQVGPSYALVRSLPGGRGYENLQVFG